MTFNINHIEKEVVINNAHIQLNGILGIPKNCKAIIIFAHGSGSGRFSPRNNFVARFLQQTSLGTLLMDLLSDEESLNRDNIFDIDLLAERLNIAKAWLNQELSTQKFAVGYFGASTGAAAALVSSATKANNIFAIVSRGGRPDLAQQYLNQVKSPTLLLVGGNDGMVIDLNQKALNKMHCEKKLKIIPGANHLFEEKGTLEIVAEEASDWFLKHINFKHG